jgi:hypothetical protein
MIPCPRVIQSESLPESLHKALVPRLRLGTHCPRGSASKLVFTVLLLCFACLPQFSRGSDIASSVNWMTDYAAARERADREDRMLLVFFRDSADEASTRQFETETLRDPAIREKLQEFVCVQLPTDAKISIDNKEIRLIDHPSFREMLGKPGIAIVDYKHNEAAYHGNVVSIFPFTGAMNYTPDKMAVILDLPRGTLTQRTLIFAIRTHPEHPAGADGREASQCLLEEAQLQAEYQAQSRASGHQHWDSRFQRIVGRLRGGAPREICAESWPGQNLVEAAIECVHSWRSSSGHWSALRTRNRFFGFDMKRGNNGVWYATGIVSTGGEEPDDVGRG